MISSPIKRNVPDSAAAPVMLLLGIIAVGFFSFFLIGDQSFWVDEFISVDKSRNWTKLLFTIRYGGANMCFYHVLLHYWLKFNESEFWVRSLSALFSIATVPVVYLLGRQLLGIKTAMQACLLLPLNAFFIQYAQEARAYSLFVLLSALSSYFFVQLIEESTRKYAAWYIVCGVLTVCSHFFGVLLLTCHAASLIFLPREAIPWKKLSLCFGIIASVLLLASCLVLPALKSEAAIIDWIPRPGLREALSLLYSLCGSNVGLLGSYVVLSSYALYLFAAETPPKPSAAAWRYGFLAFWAFGSLMIGFVFSRWVRPVWVPRYFIAELIPFILLTVDGLSRVVNSKIFIAVFALLVFCSGQSLLHARSHHSKEDWRTAATSIVAKARHGDALLFCPKFSKPVFSYYAAKILGAPLGYLNYPNDESVDAGPDLNPLSRRYRRVWLVRSHFPGELQKCDRVQQTLDADYSATEKKQLDGITILLYERHEPSQIQRILNHQQRTVRASLY